MANLSINEAFRRTHRRFRVRALNPNIGHAKLHRTIRWLLSTILAGAGQLKLIENQVAVAPGAKSHSSRQTLPPGQISHASLQQRTKQS